MKKPKHVKLTKNNILILPHYLYKYFLKYFTVFLELILSWVQRAEKINLITKSHKRLLKKNERFRDLHKDQRAFVIVNGPSLAKQDMSLIKDDIKYAVTGFFKHEIISENWQPDYYSFLDENMFEEGEIQSNFYKDLNEKIKKSDFFVPIFRGFDANKKMEFLAYDRTYYFAAVGESINSVDLTKPIGSLQGVGALSLLQAVYMGCNPIYLLGFDHDYLANRGFDHHFYKGGTMENHELDKVTLESRLPYDEEMRANAKLWKNYREIKRIADKKGISILNATDGGFLDVFPRKDFKEIFK